MSPVPPIDKEYEKIDQEVGEDAHIPSNVDSLDDYDQIPQEAPGVDNFEPSDDDQDDSESDSEPEIDPDIHFELLASSRAGQNQSNKNQVSYDNSHLLEQDIFELKNTLECENIEIDEQKSEKISSLMSNFKIPENAVPEWAKLIPENVWKKNLIDSLNAKKTDLFDFNLSLARESDAYLLSDSFQLWTNICDGDALFFLPNG
ncbi:hypothetical protein BpHYR1_002824, partial [Brachionus plicatilis]